MSGLAIRQRVDDLAERSQTLVDVLRLGEGVTFGAGLADSLGTGEIDEVDFTSLGGEVCQVFLFDVKNENTVRS